MCGSDSVEIDALSANTFDEKRTKVTEAPTKRAFTKDPRHAPQRAMRGLNRARKARHPSSEVAMHSNCLSKFLCATITYS
mmetsp:Transcript_172022/g.545942  ORF Transcript_172022/g.545942 Transcript_172022/m.545942 type:complete len:80 (+) Transcript_172022:53-292(+)